MAAAYILLFLWFPAQLFLTDNNFRETPEAEGDFLEITLPIRRAGNLILVEVQVDSIRGNFILDTGAPYLVLNQTYFRDYPTLANFSSSGITGAGSAAFTTEVDRLGIRELFYRDVVADVTNLAEIENSKGVKILGLLGTNLFSELEIEVDLKNSVLKIYRLDRKGERLANEPEKGLCDFNFDFTHRGDIMVLDCLVNGEKLKFCFDTGAEAMVLHNNLKDEVYGAVQLTGSRKLVGSSGQAVEVLSGLLKELDAGCPIENSQVVITDLAPLSRSYRYSIDGMLGYDLLRAGRVSINFKNKEIKVRRNQ